MNARGTQQHAGIFILGYTSLKTALLLHKIAPVNFPMVTTVTHKTVSEGGPNLMEPDSCLWETTYLYDEWALSTCPEKKSKLTSHFQRRLLGPMHLRLEITYVAYIKYRIENFGSLNHACSI